MQKRSDGRYCRTLTIDGQKKFFYGKTMKEANQKMAKWLAEQSVVEKEGELFETVREDWYDAHMPTLSPTTVKGYAPHYARALRKFSGRRITSVSPRDVSKFVNGLGRSRKTARSQLSVLSLIFNHAIVHYGLETNPCDHITITRGTKATHRRSLTEREVDLIRANADGTDGLFANMLLLTGLRRGEILALQYKDVDRDNNCIHVSKSVYYEGNTPYLKEPKTDAGNRKVLLTKDLAMLIPSGKKNAYIFSDDGGKSPMHNQSAYTLWSRYAKRIGLVGITPHYLRHNYATMLYKAGVDVKTAQYLLGHADISTTMNVYTHVSDNMLQDAYNKMEGIK